MSSFSSSLSSSSHKINPLGSSFLDLLGKQMSEAKLQFGTPGVHKATINDFEVKQLPSGSVALKLKFAVVFKKGGKPMTQWESFFVVGKTGQKIDYSLLTLKERLLSLTDNNELKASISNYTMSFDEIIPNLVSEGKAIKLTFIKNAETGYLEIEKPKLIAEKKAIIPDEEGFKQEEEEEVKVKEESKEETKNKKRKTNTENPTTPQKPKMIMKVPDAPMKKKNPPRRAVKPQPVEDVVEVKDESDVDDLSDDAEESS
jgi:hypothetical protein